MAITETITVKVDVSPLTALADLLEKHAAMIRASLGKLEESMAAQAQDEGGEGRGM